MERAKANRRTFENAVVKLHRMAASRRAAPLAFGRILRALDTAERTEAARQIGLSRRTAYYLACIAQAVDGGLMRDIDLAALGWARARYLAAAAVRTGKHVTKAQVTEALGKPAREVASLGVSGRSLLDFALTPRQARIVRDALAAHGAPPGAGPAERAAALVAICAPRGRGRSSRMSVESS